MITGLARDVTENAECEGEIHVEHVLARHERADQRETDDDRRHVGGGDQSHP